MSVSDGKTGLTLDTEALYTDRVCSCCIFSIDLGQCAIGRHMEAVQVGMYCLGIKDTRLDRPFGWGLVRIFITIAEGAHWDVDVSAAWRWRCLVEREE